MQIAPQSVGMAPPKPSIVKGASYAYDVDYKLGLVSATLKGQDIAGVLVATTPACSGGLSAAVTSDEGGVVHGFDMYGQSIIETLAVSTPSKYTYSRILAAPADTVWTNVYGLPYKWESGGTVNTYAGPAADGDPRGTVTPATAGADIVLDYIADQANMFGQPLSERFASPERVTPVTFTGTMDAAGAISITTTLVADGSTKVKYTMPDGALVIAANGAGTVAYQLSPVHMSQYGANYHAGIASEIVRGVTTADTIVHVTLSGAGIPSTGLPAPEPEPDPCDK